MQNTNHLALVKASGIAIGLFLIICGVVFSHNFVEAYIAADHHIQETATVVKITILRIVAIVGGLTILFFSVFRPKTVYCLYMDLASRSFNTMARYNQIKEKYLFSNATLLLCLILLLGCFLRFYGLQNQSLQNDELSSWEMSNHNKLSKVIKRAAKSDVHPPGYHVISYFLQKTIGDSETVLRLPSAVAGIFSIIFIYILGTRLYSVKEGLISALLLAVLWCPIYFSQEARVYSILLLFTLLTINLWVSMLSKLKRGEKVPNHQTVGYILSATITCYLHYFGLYLIALQAASIFFFFILKRRTLITVAGIYFTIFILFLPWLPSMLEHLKIRKEHIAPPNSTFFLGYLKYLFNQSEIFVILVLFMFMLLIFFNLINFIGYRRQNTQVLLYLKKDLLLFLWLVVPFLIIFIKSRLSTPVLTFKNLIISLPAAYCLIARSLTQFNFRGRRLLGLGILVTIVTVSHLVWVDSYYSQPHKDQFREVANFVLSHQSSDEGTVVIAYTWSRHHFNYYFEKAQSDKRVSIIAGNKNDIDSVTELLIKEKPKYVWYLSGLRVPELEFLNFLDDKLILLVKKEFLRATVRIYENTGIREIEHFENGD